MLCTENFPLPSKTQKIASQSSVKVIDSTIETKSNQDNISLLETLLLKEIFSSLPSQTSAMLTFFSFAIT